MKIPYAALNNLKVIQAGVVLGAEFSGAKLLAGRTMDAFNYPTQQELSAQANRVVGRPTTNYTPGFFG